MHFFSAPDQRRRHDAQLQRERPVLRNLVPPEETRRHLHPEGLQRGAEESLDRRPGEDSVGPGGSQQRCQQLPRGTSALC